MINFQGDTNYTKHVYNESFTKKEKPTEVRISGGIKRKRQEKNIRQ